jgi:integrase/recombinase XerD
MTTEAIAPLRQRMIEDMTSRKLCAHTQRGHVYSCKRFAAFLKRSPETATCEDIRLFQLHLAETGMSICNRNRIMTGVRFLFRVTLRKLDLAAEIYHLREPEKIPLVLSPDEMRRLLAVASSLKVRVLLSLGYGCGLRASEIVRLKVKHIDSAQKIIRIEQSKGRKDRNVMLSPEMLDLLRQWWKVRSSRHDAGIPVQERWLFPSRKSAGKPMTTRQLSRLFHEATEAAGIKKSVTLHALRHSFANSALSAKPANAGHQDRHLMIMSIRSPSLNTGHLCRRRSDEHASARTNSSLAQQITARSSLSWPRSASASAPTCCALRNQSTSRRALARTRHVRRSNPHS